MVARLLLLAALGLILAGPARAGAELRSGKDVRLILPLAGDLVAAGRSVSLDASVDGDVAAAGLDLRVTAPVSGDAMLAAIDMTLKAPIAGDLLAAALNLEISGRVAGDATLTGAEIRLTRGAHVAGDLAASGSEITLEGDVEGDATLSGDSVTVAGAIAGDLDVTATMLDLRPGTRILGDLRHTGPQPVEVPHGVSVGGTVRYHHRAAAGDGPTIAGAVGRGLALFLLGMGTLWLLPGPVTRAGLDMRRHPLRHLLLGAAILLLSPPLAALLMVSIIGIPLGMLLLGLYLLAIPVGIAVTGMGLAMAMRRGPTRTDAAALLRRYALAVVGLTLLSLAPAAGWAVVILAAALGLGALADDLLRGRRRGLAAG